ncbi:inverted repeat-binding protein [Arctopsyche grandis]|uniref:inverted repeat-binding protein n=1 Tax=Arctopsyche grandis TaxID=121162 RepID=UPI00406D780D
MESDHESGDEKGDESRWSGVPGRLLAIDVSSDMWTLGSSDNAPVTVAFVTCLQLSRRLMLEAPTNLFGIILFGTQKNDDKGLENVIQLLELKQPTVDDIQTLKGITSNIEQVREKWGSAVSFNLADALWQISRMSRDCKKKMSNLNVTILSCFTEPDKSNHRPILTRASDLTALNVDVNFINISENPFSDDSFFLELGAVIANQPIADYEPPEPVMSPEDILSLIYQRTHKKSASARLKMYLGSDIQFGVGLYHLCKTKPMPKKVNLHRETNAAVESTNTILRAHESQTRPVLRSELCMYQQYGSRDIQVSYSELTQLRKFAGSPCIKLLGFKPASTLNMSKYYLKPCAFLYPDEYSATGSTKLFVCLRNRCMEKERIAICLMLPRWYSNPRLVALVPQTQMIENGCQIQSDGFHVIYLPYVDNFKEVPVNEHSEVSDEQLECMRKIVGKLKFDFTPEKFENPKLQTLNNAIEALALNEAEPQPIEDTTLPDTDTQNERISGFVDNFHTLFGPFNVSGTKRAAAANGSEDPKRVKTEVECPDMQLLATRIKNGDLSKYTVADLKQILKWCNPPDLPALTGLKKNQLVELAVEHCKNIT